MVYPLIEKRKVLAYITHNDNLLLFIHPNSPEAGIQVPGGTIKVGESPAEAALREAREETGLNQLRIGILLGELWRDMSDFGIAQLHYRHYYHVWCDEDTPAHWRHGEFDPGEESNRVEPIPFDFYWVKLLDGIPPLIAGHDAFVPRLTEYLKMSDIKDSDEQTGITYTGSKN